MPRRATPRLAGSPLCCAQRVGVEVTDGGEIADITKANADIPTDMRSLLSLEGGVAKAKA